MDYQLDAKTRTSYTYHISQFSSLISIRKKQLKCRYEFISVSNIPTAQCIHDEMQNDFANKHAAKLNLKQHDMCNYAK